MTSIEWNEEAAGHLYRRAAYGATPDELARAVREGLDGTVDRLVNYDQVPNTLLDQRIASMNLQLIPAYPPMGGRRVLDDSIRLWLTRMIYSARPLEERLTFFWHDHFATHYIKVGGLDLNRYQTELFRRHAIGNFTQLCMDVARDPAMLFWLDNYVSQKEHPNENFGRELLELFTLGHGNYAESDVLAAARAFTGWTLDLSHIPHPFQYRDDWHDHEPKTFMGQTGDWNGDQVVGMACASFDHGRLIASKLFSYFAYEDPEADLVDRLAHIYMDSGTEVRPLVTAILKSPEMYSARAVWTKVKSPIDFVVMAGRLLELKEEIPSALRHLRIQGQLPYEPPNVAGWETGMVWIRSTALLSRINFAGDAARHFDPVIFGFGDRAEGIVDAFVHRLGPLHLDGATRASLIDFLAPGGVLPTGGTLFTRLRGLAQLILSLPEWQMM